MSDNSVFFFFSIRELLHIIVKMIKNSTLKSTENMLQNEIQCDTQHTQNSVHYMYVFVHWFF